MLQNPELPTGITSEMASSYVALPSSERALQTHTGVIFVSAVKLHQYLYCEGTVEATSDLPAVSRQRIMESVLQGSPSA